MNYLLLPTTGVTKIGLVSLGTLTNVSVYVLMVAILDVGGQYLFNMQLEFKTHLELFNMFW